MLRFPLLLLLLLFLPCILCISISIREEYAFIDLGPHLNNKGASGPGSDFDGAGNYFDCPLFTSAQQQVSLGTIQYKLHRSIDNNNINVFDNIACQGQVIPLPPLLRSPDHSTQFGALYMLISVNHGPITTQVIVTYQDGTYTTTTISLPDWQVRHSEQMERLDRHACRLSNGMPDATVVSVPILVDPAKPISSITLPKTNPVGSFRPTLHVFSITGVLVYENKQVQVISAKGTTRWSEKETASNHQREYQIVSVRVQNTSPDWIKDASVVVYGSLLKTKYDGELKRLAPGHVATVDVAILSLTKEQKEQSILVQVTDAYGDALTKPATLHGVMIGLKDYEATENSLGQHLVPLWFKSAKFGIFIHWGVYSIPSWAPVKQEYAEWYWWNYNRKFSSTYYHHRAVYGPDFEYDHFIDFWKPDGFDPHQWLDLIDSSGAKYFVFTSKHHDGFALFDTQVTDRSSVKMNPNRDFVKELLNVAKSQYPHLKRGIYFSLPEWFHPSYHDRSINWDGPPINPYTGKTVDYTGAPPVSDFVNQVQVPQFKELIQNYEPDIMWCDIGGINNSTDWQAEFLNTARKAGRQVVMNDRCGNGVSDFSTVEYQGMSHVPERFWESTRGVDPYSFGYNHQTRPSQYASAKFLLQELVLTVSKGGNFLLNIGPDASGHIPDAQANILLRMGQWIEKVSPSIFDSIPYWVTSGDFHNPDQPLYFTQSTDGQSLYVFCFERPMNQTLVIEAPMPLHQGTRIALYGSHDGYLDWKAMVSDDNGRRLVVVSVPDYILDKEDLLWVFKLDSL